MRIARIINCALMAILLAPAAIFAARGDELVHAILVSDVSAIQPGQPFRVGVSIKIEPSWHIYWKNPGESGLPTRVKLDLPPGFTAGDVQFPAPKKLVLPGNIINYGYEDQVMLIVPITPPKDLVVGSGVDIKAKVTWLVCQDMCLPGKADALLHLPVGAQAQPANRDAFNRWSKQMPATDSERYVEPPVPQNLTNVSVADAKHRHFDMKLSWKRDVRDVDWMPDNNDQATVRNVKVQTKDGVTLLSFDVDPGDAPHLPQAIRSLLVFNDADDQRHAVELNVPLPLVWEGSIESGVSK
jgi:DsbC/DsbD-like thiol-disulfide interchange protein